MLNSYSAVLVLHCVCLRAQYLAGASVCYIYILLFCFFSACASGISIWQALPYFENGMYSIQLTAPVQVFIHFPYVLMAYLPLLAAGESQELPSLLHVWAGSGLTASCRLQLCYACYLHMCD